MSSSDRRRTSPGARKPSAPSNSLPSGKGKSCTPENEQILATVREWVEKAAPLASMSAAQAIERIMGVDFGFPKHEEPSGPEEGLNSKSDNMVEIVKSISARVATCSDFTAVTQCCSARLWFESYRCALCKTLLSVAHLRQPNIGKAIFGIGMIWICDGNWSRAGNALDAAKITRQRNEPPRQLDRPREAAFADSESSLRPSMPRKASTTGCCRRWS
jgi:hypothetical protein